MDDPDAASARGMASAAAVLGFAHAAVSAYWAVGGTALIDTVGGDIAKRGREGGAAVVFGLIFVVVLKVVVALAAPVVCIRPLGLPTWSRGRVPRVLS